MAHPRDSLHLRVIYLKRREALHINASTGLSGFSAIFEVIVNQFNRTTFMFYSYSATVLVGGSFFYESFTRRAPGRGRSRGSGSGQTSMKDWVFLSPHFDDVALSVGGLVWELIARGDRVDIWTICAGDPPYGKDLTDYARMLHIFWELGEDDVPYARNLEDVACCRLLGAGYRRYTVPDCIYRYISGTDEALIKVPDDIKKPLEPGESYLITPVTDFAKIFCLNRQ
jgi:hypothetical protein